MSKCIRCHREGCQAWLPHDDETIKDLPSQRRECDSATMVWAHKADELLAKIRDSCEYSVKCGRMVDSDDENNAYGRGMFNVAYGILKMLDEEKQYDLFRTATHRAEAAEEKIAKVLKYINDTDSYADDVESETILNILDGKEKQ